MPSAGRIALGSMGLGIPQTSLTRYLTELQKVLKKQLGVRIDTVFCLTTLKGIPRLDRLTRIVDHLIYTKHRTNFSFARHALLLHCSCLPIDGLIVVDADGAFDPLDVARVTYEGLETKADAVLAQKQGALMVNRKANDLRVCEERFTDWLALRSLGKNEAMQLQTGLRWLSSGAIRELLCYEWILEGYFWDLQCSYYILQSGKRYSVVDVTVQPQMKTFFSKRDTSAKLIALSRLLKIDPAKIQADFNEFCTLSGISIDLKRQLQQNLLNTNA